MKGMNKLKEMIKRRKDEGFTLIELMIVIAVIGILAIVLVPKVGTIKTQAKSAGIDTNVRMVQGYVQSRISYWNDHGSTDSDIAEDIAAAFTSSTDTMKNPFATSGGTGVIDKVNDLTADLAPDDALEIVSATAGKGNGSIEVVISAAAATGIIINGLSKTGSIYSTVKILP